jgi:hypothetical protein
MPLPSSLVGASSKGGFVLDRRGGGAAFSEWTEPVNLGPVVNSTFDDNHPHISKDGLSLFFHSNRPGGSGGEDIWVSQRPSRDAEWEYPQNLGPVINSVSNDRVPFLLPGQRWLLFGTNRPDGAGGLDLWAARRRHKGYDFDWEAPINLGTTINTPFDDDGAMVFEDADGRLVLYFASNRPGGPGDFDVYQSVPRHHRRFGDPALVPGLNSPARDTRTAVRRNGLELFITSNRPGSSLLDIWTATRETTDDDWSVLSQRGLALVNSPANDGAPALSNDGRTMYFYSNRPGGSGGNDLYVTTRTRGRRADR